jgi:hypothetical protein
MKKLFVMVAIMCIALVVFSACRREDTQQTSGNTNQANTETPTPSPTQGIDESNTGGTVTVQVSELPPLDKAVENTWSGISIKIPSSWDYNVFGDNITIDSRQEGIFMFAAFYAADPMELYEDLSQYEMEQFAFVDGIVGYSAKSERSLHFVSENNNVAIFYSIMDEGNSGWISENEALLFAVARTLTTHSTSQPSDVTAQSSDYIFWEGTTIIRPSKEDITDFVVSRIRADYGIFLNDYDISIDPSSESRIPEIEVTVTAPEDSFDFFSGNPAPAAEALEYVMLFVGDYLAKNDIDSSEILVYGTFRTGWDIIVWGYYITGGDFGWNEEIRDHSVNNPAVVDTPPQQQTQQQARSITVSAVSGARVITQPNSLTDTFEFERVCSGCTNPQWGGASRQSMFPSYGSFGAGSRQCTRCRTWNRPQFRGN